MRKTTLQLALSLAVISSFIPLANAADLVQFTAGQPAKAAEVNANFKALNDELNSVKNFSELTEAQILALKTAVGVSGAMVEVKVDCSNDPTALTKEINKSGQHNMVLSIELTGQCEVGLYPQFNNFTLMIDGGEERATLVSPQIATDWNLFGGFNGGLFLRNLTIKPPASTAAVLFSRSAQGNLFNVVIEGGTRGVVVQANAQVYLQDVQIRQTSLAGISAYTGGQVRFFGNTDALPLVQTSQGVGLEVDQATASLASAIINAPTAIQVRNNGAIAVNFGHTLEVTGNTRLVSGGLLSVPTLNATGNFYLQQGNLLASNATIVGNARIYEGSNYTVETGSIAAGNPVSSVYDEFMALEVTNGSQVSLGRFGTEKVVDVRGQVSANNGKISALWTNLYGDLHLNAAQLVLEKGNLSTVGRDSNNEFSLSLNSNSTLQLKQSNMMVAGKALVMQSVINVDGDGVNYGKLGSSYFQLAMASSFRATNCTGSRYFNLEGSDLQLLDCNNGNAVVSAHTGSNIRIDRSTFGLVHVDSGSTAGFYASTLTGSGSTDWGDQNYNIGSNSMMYLDGTSLTNTKHFNVNGVLRLQNANLDLKMSTLACNGRGWIEWWSETAASSVGNFNDCNGPGE